MQQAVPSRCQLGWSRACRPCQSYFIQVDIGRFRLHYSGYPVNGTKDDVESPLGDRKWSRFSSLFRGISKPYFGRDEVWHLRAYCDANIICQGVVVCWFLCVDGNPHGNPSFSVEMVRRLIDGCGLVACPSFVELFTQYTCWGQP